MKPHEIKQLRTDLGWSQTDMGRYLGYTDTAIRKWENGLAKPSSLVTATLIQIRKQLDDRKQKQRDEFIRGLAATFITGGIVAFLAYTFNNNENQ